MFQKLKFFAAVSVVATSALFLACNGQESAQSKTGEKNVQPAAQPAEQPVATKSLVIFYSQNGATKKVAEIFQKVRNADVFEIALAFIVPSESQSATFVPTEKRCARAGSAAERHAAERNM